MAIDYKKEWEKLQESTGHCTVVKEHTGTTLNVIMDTQIRKTVDVREELMKEYVKEERITTEIDGGERHFHNVQIIDKAHGRTHWLIGTINVHKADFNTWCKEKRKKEIEAMRHIIHM
jgi:hypothetical protein